MCEFARHIQRAVVADSPIQPLWMHEYIFKEIVHSYRGITNSEFVADMIFERAIPLTHNLRNIKTILVESPRSEVFKVRNRSPIEEGFFLLLHNLQAATLASIPSNFSFKYVLSDFLALPKLCLLHIHDLFGLLEVPASKGICAPIEDLRICVRRCRFDLLMTLLICLKHALRRVDLDISYILPLTGNWTRDAGAQAILTIMSELSSVKNLEYLTVPKAFMKVSTTQRIFGALKDLAALKTITFQTLKLTDNARARLANELLGEQDCHGAMFLMKTR